jgi:hypothetical protein
MGKLIKSAVIGGVVFALWTMVFGQLHHYEVGVSHFANEREVIEMLEQNTVGSGIYTYPMLTDAESGEISDDFWDKFVSGPLVIVSYSTKIDNIVLFSVLQLFVLFFVAFIAVALLQTALGLTYWGKVLFVMFVAATGSIGMHLENWTEPAYSSAYTLIMIAKVVVGWFLAGMAMVKWGLPKEKKDEGVVT